MGSMVFHDHRGVDVVLLVSKFHSVKLNSVHVNNSSSVQAYVFMS
jgi:hypothetical protein